MKRAWYKNIDWPMIGIWAALVCVGLVGIYSSTQGPAAEFLFATVQQNFSRQLMWLGLSCVLFVFVLFTPVRWIDRSAYPLYVMAIVLLILTLFFGREINGARRWLFIGPFGIQVSEIAKVAAMLAVAKFTARNTAMLGQFRYVLFAGAILAFPAMIVVMQNDTGTSLPYLAALPLILFWSGVPLSYMALMVAPAIVGYLAILQHDEVFPYAAMAFAGLFTLGMLIATRHKWLTSAAFGLTGVLGMAVWLGITNVLRPHQVARIIAFTNPEGFSDTAGYHVIQSKLAIGQGGVTGLGFMQGTQTQMAFIPEQSTDFIFTVIGEEFGFIGAMVVLTLLGLLLIRTAWLGLKAVHPFARTFAAGMCGIFLTHITINVGMTLGSFPVIGLPLPLVSYGGSALLANTMLIAILVSLHARRDEWGVYRT